MTLSPSFAQKKEVQVSAEASMKQVVRDGQKVVRYMQNVLIVHEGAKMNCDSAYVLKKTNIIKAFGRVKIVKEETTITGDYLHYDGNTSVGEITGKEVKLVQKDATLTTDKVFFNSKSNTAYYTSNGILVNNDNNLVSKRGYYISNQKKYVFAGNVQMFSKDGSLYTDSLEYKSDLDIAYFYGPTRIYNKENYVYCKKGWYDRRNEQSNFSINAYMKNKSQRLFGQNIFYNKKDKYSKLDGDVAIYDSTRNVAIFGGEANYWDVHGVAKVTKNPLVMLFDKNDTLYLKSDTLLLQTFKDNSLPDSLYRIVRAIGESKFYRKDVQGKSDTLIYNTKDSTISMISNPVLWNENYQITADQIKAFTTTGNRISRMEFEGNPMMSSNEEKTWFNQIKGKSMTASFTEGKLRKLDVFGNGQTVYFLRDKGAIVTVNKVESSDLTITVKNNKLSRILFKAKPISTLYPIEKVDAEEITLKGFKWLNEYRPKSKLDIIPKGTRTDILFPKPI